MVCSFLRTNEAWFLSVLIAMTVGAFFYNLAVIFTTVCVAVVIVVQPYTRKSTRTSIYWTRS